MNCILIFLMAALTAQPADEWNALTNQTSGWLGADGVYSAKNPADVTPLTIIPGLWTTRWHGRTTLNTVLRHGAPINAMC